MEKSIQFSVTPQEFQAFIIEAVNYAVDSKIKLPTISHKDDPSLLSRKQVRDQYNISLSTIGRLMQSGGFPYIKEGRKTLFKKSDVDDYFENKKTVLQ